ncbi:cell wall hydrolase [Corynebacterium bovis]|uniref:Cell wall hydrolase n=1 Tax=Corynebacterium bovis TaxID=36808 RepID=A0A426Q622_9CORY|nr:cell wall hydrolase [Corynebacterium bovis]RRQ02232.1 cell wall hydrolase [Corynebacterium bovis]RRQ04439.1 cell wall hydrolase [Corynebacterium bovis]RRQ04876.1 cell wall hydrolase [Corynebacterium bovis]RRQ11705.1 cell wall hydrolase [Corynebacterium bovis]
MLAFAVTAGVSVHAGTAVADPSGDDAVSVEKYLADLVSQVSSAEKDVAGAEGELGGLRESANKARVDFDRSQAEAQEAQDKVLSARGHLDSSQTDLEKAQAKLNDIARSAYVNGGDAKPVTLASGGDAVADTLDRSSYIRLATEKQKSEVDRLDLARTQAANEESALRGSRDEADSRLRDARQAREAAEQTLRDSAQAVAQKMQDYQRLRAQQDEAKAKLEAARRAVDSQSAAASSFDKRRAAEAAADAADKAAADKAAADKAAAENAEPQQGADGTTATPGVRIDEKLGPVGAGEKAAVSAATGSTEAAASSTTPSATTTPATSATTTPATTAATTAATTSASTSTTEIPDSFPDTPEGDALRQAAIDGLRATADAATTAAQGASGAHAVDAALTAGRKTASQHYRAITAADETGGAATGTATDSDSDSDTTSDGTTSGTTSGTDSTGTTSGTDSTGGTGTSDDSGAGTSGTGTSGTSGTSGDDEDDSDDSTSSTGSGTSSGTSSGSGSTGSGSTGKHSSSTGDTSGTRSERIERVIARGKSQLGVRYSWGGGNYDGPTIGIRDGGVADQYGDYQNVGFDCSGLMMYAFAAAGVKLDHYSGYQYTAGEQIPVAQAERGDMLFWGAGGSEHVALYLGDGKMLEAPQSGSQVRISDVRWGGIQPYAVRVID